MTRLSSLGNAQRGTWKAVTQGVPSTPRVGPGGFLAAAGPGVGPPGERRSLPTCPSRPGGLPSTQGGTPAGGPQGAPVLWMSSLRLPFLINARDYNIGLWGPRARLGLVIRFVSFFPVNIPPFHKLINLLFPEAEKRAFGPDQAWSVSFRAKNHQLLSRSTSKSRG